MSFTSKYKMAGKILAKDMANAFHNQMLPVIKAEAKSRTLITFSPMKILERKIWGGVSRYLES